MIDQLTAIFSTEIPLSLTLAFFTAVIVFYSIFVFYFYRFLARKNIIALNLSQYNQYSSPTLIKIFATVLYVMEYIVLMPILTVFWFSILSVLILVLAKGLEVNTVLLIAAALVSAVRITSFVSEDLAKDLAKMLPFTLLAISITTAGFFDISIFFDTLTEIPELFSDISYYLIFIIGIELMMRIIELVFTVFQTFNATE